MWKFYDDYFDKIWPLAGAFLIVGLAIAGGSADAAWFALFVFGALLFGFVEYVTHRWLLHGPFWSKHHARHHTHPTERVKFPIWMLPTIFVAFFLVLPLSVYGGFLAGYWWFTVFHWAIHHWDHSERPFLHQYGRYHDVHHSGLDKNFGISHNLFDRLFGSYVTPEQAMELRRARRSIQAE